MIMVTRIALLLAVALSAVAQSNKELEKIYAEDQADREPMFAISAEQRAQILKNDEPRRKRVRELIDAGALTTAEDYVRAAFIFQHGDKPDDFLMAHVLGMIATKMDGSGAWIASASLDRYLLNTGKPQIFGLALDNVSPLNRDLLTDRLRAALCVPNLASRTKFLAALAKDAKDAVPPDNNPCFEETSKNLVGTWTLIRKDPSGHPTQLKLNCKLDADGHPDFDLSGPHIPRGANMEFLAGANLKIKVNGETFDLVVNGDTITGHYTSATSHGAIVGMR